MQRSYKSPKDVKRAIDDAYQGKRTEPRAVLREEVAANPKNYRAWLWLAYTAASIEEKRAALYNALRLQPGNAKVQQEFKKTLQTAHVQAAAQRGAFMCYSRADEVFAVELAERIKERRLPLWIDMLDVPLDADWNEAVAAALERSGVMLLVLSPDVVNSEDPRAELDFFLRRGKVVLPLLHRTGDYSELHLTHPVIDFRQSYTSGLRLVFAMLGISRLTYSP